MTPTITERFLQDAPCCLLVRTALEHLFDPDRLDQLFHEHADDQYQRELLFSEIVHLLLSVVLGLKPSVLAAYRESGLRVRHQSVYDKLKRTDAEVVEALVADSAVQVRATIAALKAEFPALVPGRRVRIVDGNRLGRTERRLKPLRTQWARGLPGRVLVVYEPACDLVTHAFLEPDAHACERSRCDDVLALVEPGDLWIADSHFCTHAIFETITAAGGEFLIRQHGSMHGELQNERKSCGRTDAGEVFEQAVTLTGSNAGWTIRRLTLVLDTPTKDGVREIHLLTNVPPEVADAVTLVLAYRQRWTIEGRFYEMAQTLNAEPKTMANPATALFAFGLGLVASNAMAMVRASLRAVHPADDVAAMSKYYMALEIRETYRGLMIVLDPTVGTLGRCDSVAELAERMKAIARRVQVKKYRKATRGPKKPPPDRGRYINGMNLSTHRLLEAAKENA